MQEIILLGGGGHCRSVIDTLKELDNYKIIGVLDTEEKVGTKIEDIEIIGTDDELNFYYNQGINYAFICLGSIGNVNLRLKLYQVAKKQGFKFPIIIDKTAIVSKNVEISQGTYVGKGAIINAGVKIGEQCIINSGVIIDHDCKVGDVCHIAPGSTLSGRVRVGDNTHIGTNSTIIQEINIGSNVLIGAGSVVVKNIRSNVRAYGNPCREV